MHFGAAAASSPLTCTRSLPALAMMKNEEGLTVDDLRDELGRFRPCSATRPASSAGEHRLRHAQLTRLDGYPRRPLPVDEQHAAGRLERLTGPEVAAQSFRIGPAYGANCESVVPNRVAVSSLPLVSLPMVLKSPGT